MEVPFGDFWIQFAAALLASVITLLLQPSWWSSFRRIKSSPTQQGSMDTAITRSTVHGDVRVQNHVIRQTQQVSIRQNIYNSPSYKENNDDAVAYFVGIIVAVVSACITFVLTGFLLQWVSYGVLLGILVLFVFAVVTAWKQRSWDLNATAVSFMVLVAAWTTLSTWNYIRGLERHGMSFESVSDSVQNAVAQSRHDNMGAWDTILDYVVPVFFDVHEHVLMFITFILLGALAQIAQLTFSVLAIVDWHAYLSFWRKSQAGKRTTTRAQRHMEMKPWGFMAAGLILSVVAFALSRGIAFDLWAA